MQGSHRNRFWNVLNLRMNSSKWRHKSDIPNSGETLNLEKLFNRKTYKMSDFHKISYFFFLFLRFILLKIILTVNQQGHFCWSDFLRDIWIRFILLRGSYINFKSRWTQSPEPRNVYITRWAPFPEPQIFLTQDEFHLLGLGRS